MKTVLAALALLLPFEAAAQVHDGFDDGDFTQNPAWVGDAERFTVADLGGDFWLVTDGLTASDTLVLATPSAASYGTWRFTVQHAGVNLSNANGVRIYLVADRADLRGDVLGYYLQLGTNNADEVRLYRQDGDDRRLELGRSAPLLGGDIGTYELETVRDERGWTVRLDGAEVLTAQDDTYTRSTYLGLWVKHSSTTGDAYAFDNFDVAGTTGPPDTVPPQVVTDAYDAALPGFRLAFSEPLDPATVDAQDFALVPATPVSLTQPAPDRIVLTLPAPLADGTYTLAVQGAADRAGNALRDTVLTYAITRDTEAPDLLSVRPLDSEKVQVRFTEPVTNGCDAARYALAPPVATGIAVLCTTGTPTDTLTLVFDQRLTPGTTYTLTAAGIADLAGNVRDIARASFTLPDVPAPFDVVINEILYAPAAGLPEFVEVFNRSTKTVDLSAFTLSDDTGIARTLTEAPTLIPPGGYAVLTRDTTALGIVFPGVAALQPSAWPSLNNGGDAVVVRVGGMTIDSVAYAPSWGGQGASIERLDPDGPSNSATNFTTTADARGGTPGAQNTRFAPDLTGPRVLTAEEVTVATVDVTFDEPLDPSSVAASAFVLDEGRVREALQLSDATVRLLLSSSTPPAQLTVRAVRDLKGTPLRDTTVAVATRPGPGDLVVNEVLFAPLQDPNDGRPDQPEYLELYNASGRTVTLRGLRIVGAPDEHGIADSLVLPGGLPGLPPDGYVLLYDADARDGAPATASRLARAFPEIDFTAPTVVLVPLATVTPGGLSNNGERLQLMREQTLLDRVDYEPRWHDAGRASVTGTALEKLGAALPAADPVSWASSVAPSGGTPGRPNSVSRAPNLSMPQPGELVLNEILYRPLASTDDGRPDQTEYVEIFHQGAEPVDLNGLLLQSAPDENGHVDEVRLVYTPTPLPPGGYAVFFRASGRYADANDPAATFAEAYPGGAQAIRLPQRSAAFSLPDGGRTLVLARHDGIQLDSLVYAPGWHASSVRDATGIALERIDPEGHSADPSNWSSSADASGGTPGTRNSLTLDPDEAPAARGIEVVPSPFSPDGDGHDDATAIRYHLATPTASLRVRIFDQQGRLVRTLTQAHLAGPQGQVVWDGRDDTGRALRIGIYVVLVEALDTQHGTVDVFKAPVVLARPLN